MPRMRLAAILVGLAALCVGAAQLPATPPEGILPVGPDGKPLNLDFETGTLKDWKAEGEAFAKQPVKGDTVAPRRSDMKSQHQGQYWIGTTRTPARSSSAPPGWTKRTCAASSWT